MGKGAHETPGFILAHYLIWGRCGAGSRRAEEWSVDKQRTCGICLDARMLVASLPHGRGRFGEAR